MRLFVAVWPSREVVALLAGLERLERPGLRWTTEDQWHVTLRFLGEVDEKDIERGKAALEPLGADGRREPVIAVAGPALARLGPSILYLPVAGLDQLAASAAELTADVGAPVPARAFLGHITVARARRGAKVPASLAVPLVASGRSGPSWQVEEVTLVASASHPKGARYQVIARYRLSPAAPAVRPRRTSPDT